MSPERKQILGEVRAALGDFPFYRALLFGSRARGDAVDESDLDLAVILQREAPFASFSEYSETLIALRRRLSPLSERYGMDLLVFTRAEWDRFQEKQSSFSKDVLRDGVVIA